MSLRWRAVGTLWIQLFGNDRPVEVEVGPERGTFLMAIAAANPQRNYFGIERSASRTRLVAAAITAARLSNVRVLHADAACALAHCVPSASVATYHIYFPDPWWKRRHHHRRLITPSFACTLHRTLKDGGMVHLVTDVEETFRLAVKALTSVSSLLPELDPPARPVRTAFELKALRRGSRLCAITFRKEAAVGAGAALRQE